MSDLDARVVALLKLRFDRDALEQALRAELQKPALHEPALRQAIDALSAAEFSHPSAADEIGNQCQAARKRLESFLQGRAKPAQEEITDANFDWNALAAIRASKGEKK